MKTTRKLASWAIPCIVALFVYACDYYEPPQLLIEEDSTAKPLTDNTNKTWALADEDKITLYKVDGEDIIKIQDYKVEGALLEFQKDIAKYQEIWKLSKKNIPLSYRLKISEFLVYHGAASWTSGFVDPTINNLSKWQFAIAIDYAYKDGSNADGEVVFTILHEFGHILTLNKKTRITEKTMLILFSCSFTKARPFDIPIKTKPHSEKECGFLSVVTLTRFELVTFSFVVRCAIQLRHRALISLKRGCKYISFYF